MSAIDRICILYRMIARSFIVVVLLVGIGFVLGVSQAQNVTKILPVLASLQASSAQSCTAASNVVRCADEVVTTGWQQFQSTPLAFSFSYPPDFTVTTNDQSVTVADGSGDSIVMTKIHTSLSSQIDPAMEQASWKIADRKTYALTTPYVTNDDGTLTSTYLFVRDFPQNGSNGDYAMVKAVITLTSVANEASIAHQNDITDPETVLNPAEKILSTFRFLEYDELNPKSGGE